MLISNYLPAIIQLDSNFVSSARLDFNIVLVGILNIDCFLIRYNVVY